MRIKTTAHQVEPGDMLVGLELEIVFSEPHSDFTWSLEGVLEDGFETSIVLPNDHIVSVNRPSLNEMHKAQARLARQS